MLPAIPPETAVIILILFVAALVRSAFGFGEALIAMPLLAGLVGVKMASPLVAMVGGTISIMILLRDWRRAEFKSIWRLAGASFAGIPFGILFLKNAQEEPVKLLLAVGLIVYAGFSLSRSRPAHLTDDRLAYGFGFVAGVLGGAYNTSGPPIVIYSSMRRWARESFRATLQGYFLVTGIVTMSVHGAAGLWTPPVFAYFAWSAPAVLLATLLGNRLNLSIPPEKFRLYIHLLLLLLGMGLLAQTAYRLAGSGN